MNKFFLDTNFLYIENIINICKNYNKNTIFYIESNDLLNSEKKFYIKFDENNNINSIINKNITSNIITGAFSFNIKLFKNYCNKINDLLKIFDNNNKLNIITLINLMINDKIEFNLIKLENNNVINLESPFNIRLFCNNFPKISAITNNNMILKQIFCFDIEDTLLYFDNNIYNPNYENIELIKYLKKMDNIIILNSIIHNNNTETKEILYTKLKLYDIPYDEIYFNKPIADYYIGSNNILSNNLEKDLGFYNNKINSRDFNDVSIKDIKTYLKKSDNLSGEIFYYKNIPNEIKDIFPIMFNYDENNKWYEMENINGIPISKLYLNEELTLEQFIHVIGTINRIHNSKNNINEPLENLNIYENYSIKLKKRYTNYDYSQFKDSDKLYNFLLKSLESYEKNNLGIKSVIHGDTVFTNILINNFGKIKMIDMRGKIDNKLSIYGDKMYDWAKLYQSIIGYDEILENKFISSVYKNKFINLFEKKFLEIYNNQDYLKYLKIITASLLFTLIPLHNNEKCSKYYELINELNIFN